MSSPIWSHVFPRTRIRAACNMWVWMRSLAASSLVRIFPLYTVTADPFLKNLSAKSPLPASRLALTSESLTETPSLTVANPSCDRCSPSLILGSEAVEGVMAWAFLLRRRANGPYQVALAVYKPVVPVLLALLVLPVYEPRGVDGPFALGQQGVLERFHPQLTH